MLMGLTDNDVVRKVKAMNHTLPPDLIMEILINTDIESLSRLRWVCKEWRRLISHPYLILHHHQKAKKVCGFISDQTSPDKSEACQLHEIHFFPHPGLPLSEPLPSLTFMMEPVHINASTPNGLLLCFGLINKRYYVCKPTTQEWSAIPSPDPERHTVTFAMSVASTSPLRFRIMRISRHLNKNEFHCEVFDSDSPGIWKIIDCATPLLLDAKPYLGLSVRWGLVLNGSFLWIKQVGGYECSKIICVDLWKEEGSTLELPREVIEDKVYFSNRLSNLHGGLGMVSHRIATMNINIWAMSGSMVEQKWEKLHVLDLENGHLCKWPTFVWIRGDFIVDNHLLINPNESLSEIFWYNFKESKYITTSKILQLRFRDFLFFKSDYFPCNIDDCPYNRAVRL